MLLATLGTYIPAVAQQILASFEEGEECQLTVNNAVSTASLFKTLPSIVDNPDRSGLNPSEKCLGATNVANADWYGNFVELKFNQPIQIKNTNRILSLLAYRSLQPKEMRIGFNSYEESAQLYFDRTYADARWERIIIDLEAYVGETLSSLWIIYSCNWNEPRSGWEEASYYFDDITLSSAYNQATSSILITPSESYQTIEDFGASDCWTGNVVGNYWENMQKEYIAEKLFSQKFDSKGNPLGIGLSNWRVNLGGGTSEQGENSGIEDATRRAECFLLSDGTYDWQKQAGQQYFMQKAKEYGCEHFVFFSNTPPVYYTKNGKGFASASLGCNLKSDCFDDFAEYLATVAEYFRAEGYPVTYISPINEPQFNWTEGQEGTPWENSDIKKLAVQLNNSLQQRESPIRIMLPEASSYDKLYGGSGRASDQIYQLFDPKSSNYVGNLSSVEPIVAGHSYWTFSNNTQLKNTRTTLWEKAQLYDLRTAQTEWSMLDAAPSTDTGFPESYDAASYMDIALFMAKVIHCDLAYANVSSWSYWTSLATEVYSQKNRFMLIRLTPSDGNGGYNAYASLFNGGQAEATPTLWALGNYSRFIRPGYRRIRLDGADNMNHLLGSAYYAPDSTRVVAVFVNTAAYNHSVTIGFNELNGQPVKVARYVTSSSGGMLKDQYLNTYEANKKITLAPRSITTLVYDIEPSAGSSTVGESTLQSQTFRATLPYGIFKAGQRVNINLCLPEEGCGLLLLSLYDSKGTSLLQERHIAEDVLHFTLPAYIPKGLYILELVAPTGKSYFKLSVE